MSKGSFGIKKAWVRSPTPKSYKKKKGVRNTEKDRVRFCVRESCKIRLLQRTPVPSIARSEARIYFILFSGMVFMRKIFI